MIKIKKAAEELRELRRRVEKLEAELEKLKEKDRDNKAIEIITWLVAIIELTTSIIALIATMA